MLLLLVVLGGYGGVRAVFVALSSLRGLPRSNEDSIWYENAGTAMTRAMLDATSTYYNASPAVRLFRWGLGVLQRLWPALGVRAAYRLVGTPLPSRWLSRPRRFPAGWQHEAWPFENASLTIYRNAGTWQKRRAGEQPAAICARAGVCRCKAAVRGPSPACRAGAFTGSLYQRLRCQPWTARRPAGAACPSGFPAGIHASFCCGFQIGRKDAGRDVALD